MNKKNYIIDFWADWCGPCKTLSPLLDEISDTIEVRKYDVEESHSFAETMGVRALPTLFLMSPDGEILERHVGTMSKEQLLEFIKS